MIIEEILKIVLIFCGLVYIESQTFIVDRLIYILFKQERKDDEIMQENVEPLVSTLSGENDCYEVEYPLLKREEMKKMNEYVFNNILSNNDVVSVDLDDDDYIPLTPSEVSN